MIYQVIVSSFEDHPRNLGVGDAFAATEIVLLPRFLLCLYYFEYTNSWLESY